MTRQWEYRRISPDDFRYLSGVGFPDRWIAFNPNGTSFFTAITRWGIRRTIRRHERGVQRAARTKETL